MLCVVDLHYGDGVLKWVTELCVCQWVRDASCPNVVLLCY